MAANRGITNTEESLLDKTKREIEELKLTPVSKPFSNIATAMLLAQQNN